MVFTPFCWLTFVTGRVEAGLLNGSEAEVVAATAAAAAAAIEAEAAETASTVTSGSMKGWTRGIYGIGSVQEGSDGIWMVNGVFRG